MTEKLCSPVAKLNFKLAFLCVYYIDTWEYLRGKVIVVDVVEAVVVGLGGSKVTFVKLIQPNSSQDFSSSGFFGQFSTPSHLSTSQILVFKSGQTIWVSALHPVGCSDGIGTIPIAKNLKF